MIRSALLAILFFPCAASAEINLHDWRYVRNLQALSTAAASGYETLALDAAAFDGAQPSMADLRIVDNGNDEVPYRLDVERSQRSSTGFRTVVLDLGRQGATTTFVLDAKPGGPYGFVQHNAVTILTTSHDFRADVKVEASSDGANWELVRDKAVIFDVSSDYKASHLTVSYPLSTRRFLRVSVTPEQGGPLHIQGGSLSREVAAATVESEWSYDKAVRREDGKTSIWDIDMGHENIPLSRVSLETTDRNFQRPIRLTAMEKGADGIERKTVLWSGVVWRFSLPEVSNEGLSLEGNDVRRRDLRVEIDNGDNPPLEVQALHLYGPRYTLHFPANRPQPYRIYTGNPDIQAPVYDLAAFGGYMNFAGASTAAFSDVAPKPSPEYQLIDKRPWSEQHQNVFWASLILLCGFLLYMINQKTREILGSKAR